MAGKTTLKMVLDVVTFIKDRMVTKEELKAELNPINNRLTSVEKKMEELYKVFDGEVAKRADLGKRVTRLEEKVFD
jgi:septation ring formation regulator EzrA